MNWLAILLVILASIFALYQVVSLILQIVKRKKQKDVDGLKSEKEEDSINGNII